MTASGPDEMLRSVRGLPPVELTATMSSPRGSFDRRFKGASLFEYARHNGLMDASANGALMGNYYFVATAADGVRAVVAMAEVAPRFTEKQVILAYEQDGEEIRSGVRLVVPGDGLAGRSLGNLASLTLEHAESAGLQPSRPEVETLKLSGRLERPAELMVDDIASMPQTEVETLPTPRHRGDIEPPRRYAGVRLYDLLDSAGIILDPTLNEDFIQKLVVARSVDGLSAVIAGGEIEPRFLNSDVIVAIRRDGEALEGDGGRFRLIVPQDRGYRPRG